MYHHKDGSYLRKVEKNDLERLLKLKQESWWGTNQTSILNMDDQEKWFNSLNDNNLAMIGSQPLDGKSQGYWAVGVLLYSNISWTNRSLLLSGSIFKDFRESCNVKAFYCAGLDFAFEILNINRVEAMVLETNAPAQEIEINLLGGKIEGRKRQAIYKSGKYYDVYIVSLLREEWEKSERVTGYKDSCNNNFSHKKAEEMIKKGVIEKLLFDQRQATFFK